MEMLNSLIFTQNEIRYIWYINTTEHPERYM
jgi:hypothetical protein